MKQKKKNITKLSLKECLQKIINEDRNKVSEYFENIKQAASLLSQVKFDCPVITQDMRDEIGDIIYSIDELKTKWIDMGYVDRTDLSDAEFQNRYGNEQSGWNRMDEYVERYSNIEPHEILNNNFSGEWQDILTAKLYNNNEQCVGSLSSLHYVYDSNKDCLVGSRNSTQHELEMNDLRESFPTQTQIRNVTGIYDDDELNSGVEAERHEDLEQSIVMDLGRYEGKMLNFQDVCKLLKNKYGLDYMGGDDDNECHNFTNGTEVVSVFPKIYYPKQGAMRLYNLHVSRK